MNGYDAIEHLRFCLETVVASLYEVEAQAKQRHDWALRVLVELSPDSALRREGEILFTDAKEKE